MRDFRAAIERAAGHLTGGLPTVVHYCQTVGIFTSTQEHQYYATMATQGPITPDAQDLALRILGYELHQECLAAQGDLQATVTRDNSLLTIVDKARGKDHIIAVPLHGGTLVAITPWANRIAPVPLNDTALRMFRMIATRATIAQ